MTGESLAGLVACVARFVLYDVASASGAKFVIVACVARFTFLKI